MIVKVFKRKSKEQVAEFDCGWRIKEGDVIHHNGGQWVVRVIGFHINGYAMVWVAERKDAW